MGARRKPKGDLTSFARSAERFDWLAECARRGEAVPLPLVEDLLCLALPLAEKRLLLQVAAAIDSPAFESMILRGLPLWDPDLAVAGLSAWTARTPRSLKRHLPTLPLERLPEGVIAYCVEHVWALGGAPLLDALIKARDPGELPAPTQAVLLRRLMQWSINDDECMRMAERCALKTVETGCPASPALIFALEYIARFAPESLSHIVSNPLSPRYWSDHMQGLFLGVMAGEESLRGLTTLLLQAPDDPVDFYRAFFKVWPPVWLRHKLTSEAITATLAAVTSRPTRDTRGLPSSRAVTWELFAGIAPDALAAAVAALAPKVQAEAEVLLGALLPDHGAGSGEPALAASRPDDPARAALFDYLYRGVAAPAAPPGGGAAWRTLLGAAQNPGSVPPREVMVAGRSLPPVLQQAFFDVLERQKGEDAYLPALVDPLHGSDDGVLASIVRALVGVSTGQALTQAVRVLGRNDVGFDVKFELCELLAGRDLSGCQADLRAIMDDTSRGASGEGALGIARTARDLALLDAMRSLLTRAEPVAAAAPAGALLPADLDLDLKKYIPNLDKLPREVVRAFRTARLLGRTLVGDGGIDISPIVDLQYKGLEILFRQVQGPSINQLVQSGSGILQRKLDVIGYGRAGRSRIEAFETYLVSLPVVADIPQFSRFKLNKLLSAIAGHRPGKRFGLDGLKAFAIFLMVFGRRQCEYGLERLFPVKFGGDRELLEFCRDLNMLQDIRNRAVHEGLAPGFHKEAEALWSLTGSLVGRSLTGLS